MFNALRQCLIPLAEDEAQIQTALDSLSVPLSTFRSRVVETLFRVTPDRAIDVTFDLDPISNVNQVSIVCFHDYKISFLILSGQFIISIGAGSNEDFISD
jgi:hypothetical protein